MKFTWKIFCTTFLVLLLSLGIGGFIIIHQVFLENQKSQIESTTSLNTYLCGSVKVLAASGEVTERSLNNMNQKFEQNNTSEVICKILDRVEDTYDFTSDSTVAALQEGERSIGTKRLDSKYLLQVVSHIKVGTQIIYVETVSDITKVYQTRNHSILIFQRVMLVVSFIGAIILLGIAYLLTRPLKQLAVATTQFGQGMYSKRMVKKKSLLGNDEVDDLIERFNDMGMKIEDSIRFLQEEAERKENFVANFTHELKTPLTAIIGYSDLIRSFDMDSTKRRECAEFIYREGKRLEQLSLKLLELFVLQKTTIDLQPCSTKRLFQDLQKASTFLVEKYDQHLVIDTEDVKVSGDATLLTTLLYNLLENACKASNKGSSVMVTGRHMDTGYVITVSDEGCGIPEDELEKVLEPFYMVDKSRARKQNGAGLGLSLCQCITALHNTKLEIQSNQNGTKVSCCLEECYD